jgi:hypothetical protein
MCCARNTAVLLAFAVGTLWGGAVSGGEDETEVRDRVVPIDWSKLKTYVTESDSLWTKR